MTGAAIRTHIRWMIRRDLPEVLAIDHLTAGEVSWTEHGFLSALRHRNCIGMVAEVRLCPWDAGTLGGFVVYELHRDHLKVLRAAALSPPVAEAIRGKLNNKLSTHRRTWIEWPPEGIAGAFALRPEWVTSDVLALYAADDRPPGWLLADALEEAGCDYHHLLAFIREGGPIAETIAQTLNPSHERAA